MKPTIRSLVAAGLTDPEFGAFPVFDDPVAMSSGAVVATPENSSASSAVFVAVAVLTVTLDVEPALAEYHISPSDKCPAVAKAPIRVQRLPAESVTAVIWFVVPA